MYFVAAALALVGVILFFVARSQRSKALDIQSTQTSSAAEVSGLASDVAKEIGPGSFSRQVELKGEAVSDSPLSAEMSGRSVVWYKATVTREYEESYTETDKDGNRRSGTRRGSEQLSCNERHAAFGLRDDTGSIEVDPAGAALDGEKTVSRFEPATGQGSIGLGSFRLDLGLVSALAGGRRTIGYRLEESAIPLGARLYVLGEASDEGGRLRLRKPAAKGGRFIVSMKSEEELVKSAKGAALGLTIGSGVLAAAGLALAALRAFGIA